MSQAGENQAGELISVVVTCYNLESYIEEAVRSALDQRDAGPFEVIVVDDCSSDASGRILARLPGLQRIEMPRNSGVMLATIAGTEAAQGDIVCFLDGDDIWEPGKLAAVRRAFRDPGLALLTHDLSFIDASGKPFKRDSRVSAVFGGTATEKWPELVREGILSLGDYVWLGSALSIRKSAARWPDFVDWAQGLPDPENVYQDWPLAYWIASLDGAQAGYVASRLLRYRIHPANHSGDARTPERAARNFRRSWLTMRAIGDLAARRECARAYRPVIEGKALINEAGMLAYQGRRIAAVGRLARALPLLRSSRHERSEALKLAAVTLLGPRLASRARALVMR